MNSWTYGLIINKMSHRLIDSQTYMQTYILIDSLIHRLRQMDSLAQRLMLFNEIIECLTHGLIFRLVFAFIVTSSFNERVRRKEERPYHSHSQYSIGTSPYHFFGLPDPDRSNYQPNSWKEKKILLIFLRGLFSDLIKTM